MRLYWRLLRFIKPHLRYYVFAVLFGLLYAGMSGVSLTMVVPFTKIIFEQDLPEQTIRSEPIDYSKLLKLDKETFVRVIGGDTKVERLGRFCLMLLLVFLVKNIFLYGWSFLIVWIWFYWDVPICVAFHQSRKYLPGRDLCLDSVLGDRFLDLDFRPLDHRNNFGPGIDCQGCIDP